MLKAPKGVRIHIGIFGRRNVGKSSLLNAITRQQVAIVSEFAGTTADPVEKPMEMLPLGPVLFIDTAGIDDEGVLGELRISKTEKIFDRTDIAILVAECGVWGIFEENLLSEFHGRGIPLIVAFNKCDIALPPEEILRKLSESKIPFVNVCSLSGEGLAELRMALLMTVPADLIDSAVIAGDLVGPGGTAILVVPIDKEAPKGRLILPQVQTIRDLLDFGCMCVVVREVELVQALASLRTPPKLVITDSQAFARVSREVPSEIPFTGFSILFSRYRGDLVSQVEGVLAIDNLRAGDKVLISEACTHHPIEDDIGRVKIPGWLTRYVGGELHFDHVQGHDFPQDLSQYGLIVHCGACMINRREVLNRILRSRQAGVAMTNYGLTIAHSLGVLERALEPFPLALSAYRNGRARAIALRQGIDGN